MNWHRSNRYLTALTPAGNPAPELLLDYDALGRLTALKDGATEAVIDGYSYDGTGNRLSAKIGGATQAYTYPTINHRLRAVAVAGVARTYDKMGNTLTIGGKAREYLYDPTGRMTQVKRAGVAVMNYRYNGRGEQVRRYLGTTNTYTLYDEAGHWLGDYDTNGAPKQQAIWLDDLPVGLCQRRSTALHRTRPPRQPACSRGCRPRRCRVELEPEGRSLRQHLRQHRAQPGSGWRRHRDGVRHAVPRAAV
ncbi:YD repeat-containing protein [Xanthomonas arboricola]|nr:YD repeat-containing protein [Xanthomonas euroxanthea]